MLSLKKCLVTISDICPYSVMRFQSFGAKTVGFKKHLRKAEKSFRLMYLGGCVPSLSAWPCCQSYTSHRRACAASWHGEGSIFCPSWSGMNNCHDKGLLCLSALQRVVSAASSKAGVATHSSWEGLGQWVLIRERRGPVETLGLQNKRARRQLKRSSRLPASVKARTTILMLNINKRGFFSKLQWWRFPSLSDNLLPYFSYPVFQETWPLRTV